MTLDSDKIVTVRFEPIPLIAFTLTTLVIGDHGRISPTGGLYENEVPIPLTASPEAGYRLKGWTGTDDDASADYSNTVTLVADTMVTVEFEPIPINLIYELVGGQGTTAPTSGTYDAGTLVALSVAPDAGFRVRAWTGSNDDITRNVSNTVILDTDKTVTVEFASIVTCRAVSVKTRKTTKRNALKFSGSLAATQDDFVGADQIQIGIWSDTGFPVYQESIALGPDDATGGKYRYKNNIGKLQPGAITSLKIDLNKHTLSLAARNIDLTGLQSPFYVDIAFGNFVGLCEANEEVINGAKPIPLCLLSGFSDALRIDKAKVKSGNKGDSLAVIGGLAAQENDLDFTQEEVTIRWGDTFNETLPLGSFTRKKGNAFIYKRPKGLVGFHIAAAKIDLDKCTFILTIIKAPTLDAQGGVTLTISSDSGRFQAEDEFVF